MAKLKELGIDEFFIYPQINWNAKSSSINNITQLLNIGVGTIALIDDQPFERDEVAFNIPEVLCIDAADLMSILSRPELNPRFITEDSILRRKMYMDDIKRNEVEKCYTGTQEEFLASLDLKLSISPLEEGHLERAEELTVRTNQLNATGYTYSYEELNAFRISDKHKLFIAALEDKYGSYGKIGLTLIECDEKTWVIKLLLMSCRVMSKGIGTIMLNYIMRLAQDAGVRLQAEFVPTGKNKMMFITYKFAGFKEIKEEKELLLLENDLKQVQPLPYYVTLELT